MSLLVKMDSNTEIGVVLIIRKSILRRSRSQGGSFSYPITNAGPSVAANVTLTHLALLVRVSTPSMLTSSQVCPLAIWVRWRSATSSIQ